MADVETKVKEEKLGVIGWLVMLAVIGGIIWGIWFGISWVRNAIFDNSAVDFTNAELVLISEIYEESRTNRSRARDLYHGNVFKVKGYARSIDSGVFSIWCIEDRNWSIAFHYDREQFSEIVRELNPDDIVLVAGELRHATIGSRWSIMNGSIIEVNGVEVNPSND